MLYSKVKRSFIWSFSLLAQSSSVAVCIPEANSFFFVTIFKKPDGSLFAACNICEHGQNGSMCAECWLYVRHEMERDPYQNEL